MTDKTYTLTEILADVVETSRMVQVSIDGRTAMYWDDWVAHLDDAFSEDLTPDPSPSGEVVQLIDHALHNGAGLYQHIGSSGILAVAQHIAPIIESEVRRRLDGVERYTANVSKDPVRRSGVVIFVDDLTPKGAKHE